jgi:hypothetical protein
MAPRERAIGAVMLRCADASTKTRGWLESWVNSGDVWRLAAIQGTPTPSEGIEQEILKLEQTSNDASLKKDRAALEQLLADDYMSLNSNGTLTNKAEEIAESMGANWTDAKPSNLKVRVYGNTAVVTGNLMLTGSAKGYVADHACVPTYGSDGMGAGRMWLRTLVWL